MTRDAASGQLWPEKQITEKHTSEKHSSEDLITAWCDGGSRGNPGPSGYGVVVQDAQKQIIGELNDFLGRKTNNFAEYSGLLAALEFALAHRHPRLRVISDSELMVKQIKGQYKVNSPELRPLYDEAKRRIAQLEGFQIQHVLREKNRRADELANQAMDRGMGRAADRTAGQPSAGSPAKPSPPREKPRVLSGFVKGGVVHLLDGELPDGVFVKITREPA
jgi:probable phosphoglycerate mutase